MKRKESIKMNYNKPNDEYGLRDLQNCFTRMLEDLQMICEANNINLFLVEGTALGARRHNGFIPWDDDLDIAMTRADYIKFKKVFLESNELKEKYFYQDYITDPQYPIPFAKIRKNNTVFLEEGTKELDMHQGIYIDIFPLDYSAKTKIGKTIQLFACQLYETLLRKNIPNNPIKRAVVALIEMFKLEKKAMGMFNKIITHNMKDTGIYYSYFMCGAEFRMTKSEIFPGVKYLFEGNEYYCFNNLEKYLSDRYGDYMTIPNMEDRLSSQHNLHFEL